MNKDNPENQLHEEGKMLAIEAIIRSKFGNINLQSGDQAIAILRSKKNHAISSRSSRHSTRQMPAVNSQFPIRTMVAVIMGAVLPMAVGLCIFMYIKYLENILPGRPKIIFASTDTKVVRDSKSFYLKEDMLLLPKDLVVTGDSGRVEIKYEDGSQIAIESSSQASFIKNDKSKKILILKQGNLFAEIATQTKESNFNFYTKNALVDVIGTSFDLSSQNEITALKMKTGKVKITDLNSKEEHIVKGGEQLTIGLPVKPALVAKKLNLHQFNQPGLTALYHFSECQKNTLMNLKSDLAFPLDFSVLRGSIVKPRKDTGVTVFMETYLINNSLKQLLGKFAQSNEFSIELWVKPNEEIISGEDSLIFGAGMSQSAVGNMNWMIYIGQTNGKVKGALHTIGDQEKYLHIISKDSIEAKPTHIVFMKDKGYIKLYVNGELSAELEFNNSLTDWNRIPSGNLLMGGTESGSHNWQGGLYLMAFYEKALTNAEVLSSYQAGY